MIVDLIESPLPPQLNEVGGKAFNLHKLAQIGLPVPRAFALSASEQGCVYSAKETRRLKALINAQNIPDSSFGYAVRSSAIGEDGVSNSCAGIYESYLYVPKSQVFAAVQKVWDSLDTSRSKMYTHERGMTINSMGVVIQEMIDADYSGVAFSVCPIERDARIALIEAVAGIGESLVSGTKTPATVRVNKLTGLARVQRNGADNLATELLEKISDTILPLLNKIESAYGTPVDVEWAMVGDRAYIVQARAITT